MLTLGAALLGCPLEKIDPAGREVLAVSSRPVADGKTPPVPAEGREALTRAVDSCAKEHGWNTEQRWEANGYTLNIIMRDEMAKIATVRGVDPAKIETAIRSLPAGQRSPLEASQPATVAAVRAALTAQGIDMDAAPRANVATALARAWMWLLFLTAES